MQAKQGWTERFANGMQEQMYWVTSMIQARHEIKAYEEIINLYEGTIFSDEIQGWKEMIENREQYLKNCEVCIKMAVDVMQEEQDKQLEVNTQ